MNLFGKRGNSTPSDKQSAENFSLKIANKMIDGMSVAKLHALAQRNFTVSRIYHNDSGTEEIPYEATPLHMGDKVNITAPRGDIEAVAALMGCKVNVAHKKRFF